MTSIKVWIRTCLFSLIKACEVNSASVRAMICDMGNGHLLKQLNVYSNKNHFFDNPEQNNRRVYIILDVPHCLKNLRNHTFDYGLVIQEPQGENVVLKKEHFEQLL